MAADRRSGLRSSLLGAEFRSLWIAGGAAPCLAEEPTVSRVTPLFKAHIAEVTAIEGAAEDDYRARVTGLIFDQLCRAAPIAAALPWPSGGSLARLCEALYADPADERSAEDLSRELGMSLRSMTRRFEAELGVSLRLWRRRMRLFKAIGLYGGGLDVTRAVMALGYGSPSAFTYAFRTGIGMSPESFILDRSFKN